ncbi:MAG TPA: hypothetical protein VG709_04640, partial [Actinomycetota bacterium]|nr:hypothetical protein [Actinomycetota bacterium]
LVLLLAAMSGVFWTVLKVTIVAVLTTILTLVLLAWIGVWYVKRRFRSFVRDYDREIERRRGGRRDGLDAPGWKHPDEPLPRGEAGPADRQPPA